ncbi:MAG: hypothetical protein JW770_01125 [Actinobacteria bacterium]|nr:hypothetical protein [Actinomycetota bacterium]
MKRRNFFLFLVIITLISLVSLSAQCFGTREAPTVKLEIYDGPDYSETGNMCYYRVEAITTGSPDPEIEFDDEDNVSPIGSGRVEVGVEAGSSYTLTATAVNSSGTATATITLEGQCSGEIAEEEVEEGGEEEETAEEGTAEDGTAGEEETEEATEEEEETGEDEDGGAVRTAPTIEIEIYMGPTLQEDVCYYRVEAHVTGNPAPTVNFSRDDSSGAWGSRRAQVNINNPGDTYTLTATATNSEGTATDTMEFTWGCEIPEEEEEPEEHDVNIGVTGALSGYIIVEHSAHPGATYTYVGDYTNDRQIKTYLSFDIEDISDLDDVDIKDASVSMPVNYTEGHPEALPDVHVRLFDYGSTLELADQGTGGDFLSIFPTSATMTNFNFSTAELEAALQDAVDDGDDRFQLKISLSGVTSDGIQDWYRFVLGDISLHIEYEIPG